MRKCEMTPGRNLLHYPNMADANVFIRGLTRWVQDTCGWAVTRCRYLPGITGTGKLLDTPCTVYRATKDGAYYSV